MHLLSDLKALEVTFLYYILWDDFCIFQLYPWQGEAKEYATPYRLIPPVLRAGLTSD